MSSAPDEDAATVPQPSIDTYVAPPRSTVLAPTVTVTAKATAKRITKEAVAALLLLFADARWPLNTPLPRGKLGKDLAAIVLSLAACPSSRRPMALASPKIHSRTSALMNEMKKLRYEKKKI